MSEITKCPVCRGTKIENGMGGVHKPCTHCAAVGYVNTAPTTLTNDDEIKRLQDDNKQLVEDRKILLENCEALEQEIAALNKKIETLSPSKSKKPATKNKS